MGTTTATYQEKVKSYMKVFYILVGLTVLELFFVEMHKFIPGVPHLLTTILVCTASLAKAVYVGWYFMHLNHETRWLRRVVLLSMTTFFYAIVLIPDTIMSRPQTKYIPEPARVYQKAEHGAAHESEHVPAAVAPVPAEAAPAEAAEEAEWK